MCHLVNKLGLLDKSFNLLTNSYPPTSLVPSTQCQSSSTFSSLMPNQKAFQYPRGSRSHMNVFIRSRSQISLKSAKKKSGIHCNGSHVSAKISSSFVYSRPIVSVLITHIYRCGHSELLEVIRCSANRSAHLNHSYLSSPVPQP